MLQVERRGDGVRDALHGAQLGDLALQPGVGPAIETRVLDANGQLAGHRLQEGDLVIGKFSALQGEEVDDADEDFGLGAAAEHHRHRNLGRVNILPRGRNRGVRWVAASIRGRDYSLLRGCAPSNRHSRMKREHADRGGVETDRGAQGERVRCLVIEHDAAGIGAGCVSQDPDGRLQPVGKIEIRGCRAIDTVERGQPWQRGVADRRLGRRGRFLGLME